MRCRPVSSAAVNATSAPMPTPPAPHRAAAPSALGPALLLLGTLGFAAAWAAVSLATGRTLAWMAVLAAADVALLLRLGRFRPGTGRSLAGAAAWAAIVVLAGWSVIAGHLGKVFGLTPWASATRLGADHAWTLATLAYTPADVAWLLAGLVAAVLASR